MSTERIVRSVQLAVVRAYDDEPVRLRVLRVTRQYVVVATYDTAQQIGFPRDRVYAFDQAMFEAMRQAFDTSDIAALSRLWNSCAKWREHITST
jgi:hypothetical protein